MKKQSKKFVLAGVVLLAIAGLLALTSCKNDSVPEPPSEADWLQEQKKELEGKTEGTITAPSYLTKGGLVDLAKLLRDLPDGVRVDLDLSQATGLTYIAAGTFIDCRTLQSVKLPPSVTEIGNYAFEGCASLTKVTIPKGVTTIGTSAFQDCTSLSGVTIPAGVTTIGASAFEACESLAGVTIPASVTEIGQYAFQKCTSLTSVTILKGVATIGVGVFQYCQRLTQVTIPASVTTIGDSAFTSTGLTQVTIPASVTTIEAGAFSYTGLTSVTIPDRVTTIEYFAFAGCSNLTQVIFEETKGWYTKTDLYNEDELPESIDVGTPSTNAQQLGDGDWRYMHLIRVES